MQTSVSCPTPPHIFTVEAAAVKPQTGGFINNCNFSLIVPETGSLRSGCWHWMVSFWREPSSRGPTADWKPHVAESKAQEASSCHSHSCTNLIHEGPTHMTSSSPNYGLGFQCKKGGTNILSITPPAPHLHTQSKGGGDYIRQTRPRIFLESLLSDIRNIPFPSKSREHRHKNNIGWIAME